MIAKLQCVPVPVLTTDETESIESFAWSQELPHALMPGMRQTSLNLQAQQNSPDAIVQSIIVVWKVLPELDVDGRKEEVPAFVAVAG